MRNIFSLSLGFSLILQPVLAQADVAATALGGVAGAFNATNNLVSSVQYSQNQMQGLVNQFALLRGQTAAGQTAQSQFDLVKTQLAVAMAEANQCVQKSIKDVSKYKKAPADPAKLLSTIDETPTCNNYGAIIDSIRANADKMRETNAKMACITNFQNKVNQIADGSKAAFGQLTQAANQVYGTRQKIIDTEQGIVDKIDQDMNAQGGYKDQLNKLKDLSTKISNALGSGSTTNKSGGQSSGIGLQLTNLKRSRKNLANNWYYKLMGTTQACFSNTPTFCPLTHSTLSGKDCIQSYATSAPSGSAVAKAQAASNAGVVAQILTLNSEAIKATDLPANIDVKNPDGFLAVANQRFKTMLAKVSSNFSGQALQNKNSSAVTNAVNSIYQDCYDKAVAGFQADMASDGSDYKSALNAVEDSESSVNNDIKNLIDETQQQMTSFRTSFNKVYQRDLSQFSANCTASDDAYASADCLRKLQVTLKGGIEGTSQTTKLDNGTSTTYKPGATIMNLQTMALDQAGNPTIATQQTSCVGFDECVNVLDRYRESHATTVDSQKRDRTAFVEAHNKTIDAALTGVAAQFAEMSKMMVAAVQGINEDLGKIGVSGTLSTKQVDGEALKANEKTGIYDMPTSMKAAFAGVGSYSELGDPADVTSGYNSRMSDLSTKASDASKMKALCSVKKSDFDTIANRLGTCDVARVCDGNQIAKVLRPLETVIRKGQSTASPDDRGAITGDYVSCQRSARSVGRDDRDSAAADAVLAATSPDKAAAAAEKKADAVKTLRSEATRDCGEDAVSELDALAGDSRASLKSANGDIMNAIRNMTSYCPENAQAAAEACQDAKKAAKNASPGDEGETIVDDDAGEKPGMSNPLRGSAK